MHNTIKNEKPVSSFSWYQSLQFKIAILFVVLFFIITYTISIILNTFSKSIIEEGAYQRLNHASSEVISELQKHTILATTLAETMANLATSVEQNNESYHLHFPQVINYPGAEAFIAGGGIWPAPYQFNRNIERHSFFWARDESGSLHSYQDYNLDSSKGYHQEEWYVPATHLTKGSSYWSKSYTDLYSLQPMVTVSSPIIKQQKNIGVATIDLKLEGLHQLLAKVSRSFSGYAFAVDRNGTFLSYPETKQVLSNINDQGLTSFINYQELAKKQTLFHVFSNLLDKQQKFLMNDFYASKDSSQSLSTTLSNESYQINQKDAQLIVASLLHAKHENTHVEPTLTNTILENDPILNEPVFVSINIMPATHWKIITVMPYSEAIHQMVSAYQQLMISTFIALLLTLFIIWLFIRYFITSPIIHLTHQVQYYLDDDSHTMKLFNTDAKGELRALVDVFNLRTRQLLHSQNKIEKLAHFDSLTDLPNRRLLINKLNQSLNGTGKENTLGALFFIDLDNFKRINDSLGHHAGDQLLVHVANRLTRALRNKDIVARLGGDEFVVLITQNQTSQANFETQLSTIAQKLVSVMKSPINLNNHLHYMTLSIGISVFSEQECTSDELLRQADTAMYNAKAKGKNGFSFFNTKMQERAYRSIEIEDALRNALNTEQLFLIYQPQVDTEGTCIGAEALIRWTHPQKGVLPPFEFIEIAEECGLIVELGTWVIETACAQLQRWNQQGIYLQKLSVNVSPKQFRDTNLINTISHAIEKHNIPANVLTLEITEGVVIEDIQDTIEKMTILKSLGVQLSIDDFGTGYSSLKYLKELPLDQLKIDQSFIRDINNQPKDAMIVETIIAMGKHLGFNLIAEGVEELGQVELLINKGCKQFQGYYFSKPLAVKDFNQYINAQATKPSLKKIKFTDNH